MATCNLCGEKAQISPTAGMCIVCMTGEVQDRTAEFTLHDINCPETEYAQREARRKLNEHA